MQLDLLFDIAQHELNIILPNTYVDLTLNGTFKKLYVLYNFYFLDSNMINLDKVPCAIGATKLLRKNKFIPINNTLALLNNDGNFYYLNTDDNKIYDNHSCIDDNLLNWIKNNFPII